jgi:hypothetical protein
MWYYVIVLSPHRLKRCMLLNVTSAPNTEPRVLVAEALTNLHPYHRDAAEPTMVAVALMQSAPIFNGRHPDGFSFVST